MTQTSRITIDEAARRLSVSTSVVQEHIRLGKLETSGEGENLRVLWPEADPARELYPQRQAPIDELAGANGHATRTGTFDDDKIQPVTNDATDPQWLVPTLMFLWIVLFLAGGIWLFYIVRFPAQLATRQIG